MVDRGLKAVSSLSILSISHYRNFVSCINYIITLYHGPAIRYSYFTSVSILSRGKNGVIPTDHFMQYRREKSEDAVSCETMRARRSIINHGFSGDESETRYRRSYEGG